jgi:hypothetical protein
VCLTTCPLGRVRWVCLTTCLLSRVRWVCLTNCPVGRVRWVCLTTYPVCRVEWVCLTTCLLSTVRWVCQLPDGYVGDEQVPDLTRQYYLPRDYPPRGQGEVGVARVLDQPLHLSPQQLRALGYPEQRIKLQNFNSNIVSWFLTLIWRCRSAREGISPKNCGSWLPSGVNLNSNVISAVLFTVQCTVYHQSRAGTEYEESKTFFRCMI